MTSQELNNLQTPDTPGVYFFKKGDDILYIGRATSLRDRLRSYFNDDLIHTRGAFLVDMVTQAETIKWQGTGSVLEAIILEANLIKKFLPRYNTKEKDNRSFNYVIITKEDFPRVLIIRGRNLEEANKKILEFKIKKKFGPFPQAQLLRDALKLTRKIFPFRDEKSENKDHEVFYRSIGLSPDTTSPEAKKEYADTIRHLILFFEGKTSSLQRSLEKKMNEHAKALEFEKAQEVKRTIYALHHIQDIALIKESNEDENWADTVYIPEGNEGAFRIEAYDIAHLGGKNVVGVMTVLEDGEYNKNEYRKFKLSKEKNDDVGNLKEIIKRRLSHPEWRLPQIMVIDGGEPQLNVAKEILASLNLEIPVVAVVKDARHVAREVIGDKASSENHAKNIIKINAEAHRFAIAYHRHHRNRAFRTNL